MNKFKNGFVSWLILVVGLISSGYSQTVFVEGRDSTKVQSNNFDQSFFNNSNYVIQLLDSSVIYLEKKDFQKFKKIGLNEWMLSWMEDEIENSELTMIDL